MNVCVSVSSLWKWVCGCGKSAVKVQHLLATRWHCVREWERGRGGGKKKKEAEERGMGHGT